MRQKRSLMNSRARGTRWWRVSLLVAVINVSGAGIATTSTAGASPTSIPSPVAGGWQLNGSATLVTSTTPSNLQLTAATTDQAGSAFWPTPVAGVGISAAFDASISSGSGADGLTFTLADASVSTPKALGTIGGGEGFSGITGIAVSLDTYKNSVNPSSNFVGIATGPGPVPDELTYATTNSSIASLRNTLHHFVVTTTSSGLTVTMDGTQVLNYTTSLPASVLVGFTGGTGGLTDVHAVQNVSITAGASLPPTVTVVNPTTGPSGTSVTISGTHFTGASAVTFGVTAASPFTVNNDTTITATVPSGSGTVGVTVTTSGGTSATNAGDQFTYSAGSSPSAIPSPVAGGWRLNGSAALVTPATPSNLQLTSATSNEAGSAFWPTPVAGVGISAAFDASIGSGSGADGLTFTMANASVTAPTALGTIGGGEGFSGITGIALSLDTYKNSVNPSSNFVGIATGPGPVPDELTYATTNSSIPSLRNTVHHFVVTTFSTGLSVTMDGNQVLTYSTSLPTSVLVGFTGGTGGLTDIHAVQNVSITAGAPPPVPTVTGVNPTSGVSGNSVTLSGTNFTGASDVTFGGMAASTYTVTSSTSITAIVPSGSGTVDVSVTTAGGTSLANANDKFTYTGGPPPPAPAVTGVNPATAPSGTTVSISGTNFTGASAVNFGGVAASTFNVTNDTTVTAAAPSGSGTVDVTVTTSGGTSPINASDKFTYSAGSSPVAVPSPVAGGWQLNGTAALISSSSPANLQLTSATSDEAGSAFWPTPVAGVGISAAFDAFIGSGSGADGLTFTLADAGSTAPTALGVAGGGEGYSGITGIAVSLDTYKNSVNPSSNFVGIATGPGSNADELNYVTTNSSIASLRNTVHHFVVTTSSAGLSVTMDGTPVLNYATALPPSVLVGFTGGTGGSTDIHAVQNVSITAGTPPRPPTVTGVNAASGPSGSSVTVSGTNLTGASAVNFAGLTAPSFAVTSATTITATVPSGAGTVDVTVTTPSGTSTANAGDTFTFTNGPPAPVVTGSYRNDLGRSGYYPSETGLTTANASSLKLHWTDSGGAGGFAQPIVADNMVFWSDWTGALHGTALSGTDNWTTNLGTDTPPASQNCVPASAGPTGAPTAATVGSTTVLYVPGGNGVFYAINAQTGALIWSTTLGAPPNNFLWDSPILYEGSVYEGVASYGDCPLVQGKLVQMNATTGAVEHIFDTVPNNCTGGGIWGSATVDSSDGSIYIATGTPGCGGPGSLAPSIVKLNASNLSMISNWSVPSSAQAAGDADFGSTPTLFTGTVNGKVTQLVGAVDKNAIFYAFDRSNLAAGPVWQSTLATASSNPSVGSIISASWDGSTLYVAGGTATINGTSCMGNIDALNPNTGAFVWRSCLSGSMFGGLTVVPGVIVEGTLGGTVLFLNAANGTTLFSYKAASLIQGECTVSNGVVYIPVANGSLVALGQ